MKGKTVLIVLLFFSTYLFAQSNKLSLFITFNSEKYGESILLSIKNNDLVDIEIPKTIDGSFWCLTKPCITFLLEEKIGETWSKIDFDITKHRRCGNYSDWTKINRKINIKPNKQENIGQFRFPNYLSGWFGIYGNKKLRLTVKYSINGDKIDLVKYGYKKIELTSKPLEINYTNTKHPVDYLDFFNQLLNNNQLTKKRFRKGAKTIIYPGNKKERLELALKIFGIQIENVEDKKVYHDLFEYTTDKKNPALITTDIINDNGIFYLIAYIRYARYKLEKGYTKDFCKVYKIN